LFISVILYILGLLGDSYYGITSNIPVLNTIYATGFHISSYTRNGILLAPVFLALGGLAAKTKNNLGMRENIIGFAASMSLMMIEGVLLHMHGLPRHDSMYIFLLPSMYFLFQALINCNGQARPLLRNASLYIYLLHPLLIIAVRGGAGIMGLSYLLVNNNMVHYLSVCFLSILLSVFIIKLKSHGQSLRSA
jgi:serine/alanine racemase